MIANRMADEASAQPVRPLQGKALFSTGGGVSLGAGCRVESSIIQDSILEDEAQATSVILEKSLVGRKAHIQRRAGIGNAGDQTEVML